MSVKQRSARLSARPGHLASVRARRLAVALSHYQGDDAPAVRREVSAYARELRAMGQEIRKLRAELEENRGEAEALRKVAEATGLSFDLEEMLKVAASIAVRMTGTDSCQVYLWDAARQELILRATDESFGAVVGKIRLKLGEGITGWAARERRSVAVSQRAWEDPRFRFFAEMQEGEYESILSVPLLARGDVLGVINVRTRQTHEYTLGQIRLLSGIANQVAGAVERSRTYRQLERTTEHLHTLSEVSQAVTSNLYMEELVQLLVSMTAQTMNYSLCTVLLKEGNLEGLTLKASWTADGAGVGSADLAFVERHAARVTSERNAIAVPDVKMLPVEVSGETRLPKRFRGMAGVPLLIGGEPIGVLTCCTELPHVFSAAELTVLQALATQAALAIEHAKLMVRSAVVQEMHHRVGNNLQQIVSLIRLELRFSKYSTVDGALNDTLSRIMAISSVHELLRRDDLDSVSTKKVAESIVHATQQSVVPPDRTIEMRVDGDDFVLPFEKATSMALVLNELVQNAVEHGFKVLDRGRINIRLTEMPTEYTVVVDNDGEPLPEGFTTQASENLGLRIVETLVRGDLNGTFSLESDADAGRIVATVTAPR
ncbi:MAG: GAF domain-containing protein [Armatimonadetes bacterium]|nr:GAF domain-containing protein [Armatimonadota bacterium]MDE2207457.1 GAF domain-containing protein [Armatimonadota bacterium]